MTPSVPAFWSRSASTWLRVNNLDIYNNLEGVLEMICNTLGISESVTPHPPR